MALNKNNSTKVEFFPRNARSNYIEGSNGMGIPIEKKYIYIGAMLTQKLVFYEQIHRVKKEILYKGKTSKCVG